MIVDLSALCCSFTLKDSHGALLAKLDIKTAYHNIPVPPGDHHVLGMRWQGQIFLDTFLPFGLSSATKIFNATADALEWDFIEQKKGLMEFTIHYLNDFFLVGVLTVLSVREVQV